MTIRGLLERNAAATPDRVAMTWCENKVWKRRTWREWLARVRDLAEGYGTRFALKPREENVALILGNSPAWLECYLAQSGAGVAVVPMDPKFKPAEMEYILNDAEVRVITTDTAHLRMMMNLAPKLKHLRGIVVTDGIIFEGQRIGDVEVVDIEQMRISGGGAWYDAHVAAEEDVASIIYTSGTTGKPKGAMLTQRNFVSDIEGGVSKDPAVQDVIVIGYTQDGEPGERVGAIVYPNEEWLAAQNGGAKPDWLKVEKTVVKRVQEKSAELADYKHIRKIVVSHEPLERTSVGKIRRVAYKGKLDE